MPSGVYQRTEQNLKNLNFHKGHTLNKGENHPRWKGDKASYISKHFWAYNHFEKSDTCESCKTTGLVGHWIHWANISGEYKRDRSDWMRLCAQCHKNRDSKGRKYKK